MSRAIWTTATAVLVAALCVACGALPQAQQGPQPRPTGGASTNEPPTRQSRGGNDARPAPQATAARRYNLDISTLITQKEGGEIETIGPFSLTDRPTPLTVLRQTGFRGELTSVALPGLESRPPYLNCVYQLVDRSSPRSAVITRDVKFWYGQKPSISQISVYGDLIGLKLADVAVDRCPNNWGEALTAAMGPEIWAQVKKKPNPNSPSPQVATSPPAASPVQPAVVQQPGITTTASGRPLSAIEQCDIAAAHADDPEAFSQGVSDEQLNDQFVIASCSEAIKADKTAPRLAFQLARGYLKSNSQEEAIEWLLVAAKMGHGASLAYLADMHLDGAPGIEADPTLAKALYEKAVQSGFVAAKKILAEFEDYTDKVAAAEKEEKSGGTPTGGSGKPVLPFVPPGTNYRVASVMDNIVKGDLNAVGYNEIWSKFFLIEVASTIGYFCQSEFSQEKIDAMSRLASMSSIDKTSGGGLVLLLNEAEKLVYTMANPKAAVEFERRAEMAGEQLMLDRSEEAAHDGVVFLSRYGCSGEQVKAFEKNAVAFIGGENSRPFNADTVFQSCVVHGNNPNVVLRRPFCSCVTRKMATASITRGERVSLMSSFMPAAQTIVDKQFGHFESCR